jgi:hypothetical protein
MVNKAWKIVIISAVVLMLAIPALAQNTKGDKPTSTRENRFKKTGKKEKSSKRIRSGKRSTSSLRAYKPRGKSKGGERAGRPVSPIYNSSPSEQQKPSRRGKVSVRSATGRTRNTYPQSGQYVNSSSTGNRSTISNRSTVARLSRLQSRNKPSRRKITVVPRSASRPFIARRSINSWTTFPKPKRKVEKAYVGDITGRKIRTKNYETKRPAIISKSGGRAISRTADFKNEYRQTGRYVTKTPGRSASRQRAVSNTATLSRLNKLQTNPGNPGRKRKVTPRSASQPFIRRKSMNTWAQFPRKKHKGEQATTKDLAGQPLRGKNFQTQIPVLKNPTAHLYKSKKRVGDRAYKGPATGGYSSISGGGKAWRRDIAKRKIRGLNRTSRIKNNAQPGGYRSASQPGEKRTGKYPIPPRTPGIGARGVGNYKGNLRGGRKGFDDQGEGYSGNYKSRRQYKGGGSVSGKLWNNRNTAIPPRQGRVTGMSNYRGNLRSRGKAFDDQGEGYSGGIKSSRQFKGGGSVSGKLWNNQGRAIPARSGRVTGMSNYRGNIRSRGKAFDDQGEGFSGNIKGGRPLKGGGSRSGKLWNNQGIPVQVRGPGNGGKEAKYQGNLPAGRRTFADQGEGYSGSIKFRRQAKGGGSRSGKLWNNQGIPVQVRGPGNGGKEAKYQGNLPAGRRTFADQGEGFSGYIKARRPLKGGGSVSGKLWNNKETPIAVKPPSDETQKAGNYPGNIKLSRFKKSYIKNPNSAEASLKKKRPDNTAYDVDGLQVKVKRRNYKSNPNSSEDALKKLEPTKGTLATGGLQVKVKRPEYARRKNAPEDALLGLKPTKSSIKAYVFSKGIKRDWKYVKNSSSSDDALRVREPGKAFGKATDYQGNIKMKKFELFAKRDLHPDAKFIKLNKNNVAEERDMLTNFKLWWARLFKKNDTQPDHLKDKRGKPRYDKGESGLWND